MICGARLFPNSLGLCAAGRPLRPAALLLSTVDLAFHFLELLQDLPLRLLQFREQVGLAVELAVDLTRRVLL